MNVLHLLFVLKLTQWLLDIFVNALREYLVRGSDALNRLEDLIPWRLKDAGKWQLIVSIKYINVTWDRPDRRDEPKLGGGVRDLEDE